LQPALRTWASNSGTSDGLAIASMMETYDVSLSLCVVVRVLFLLLFMREALS
jgi:hypothetical protein